MVDPNGKISVFNGLLKVADTQDALGRRHRPRAHARHVGPHDGPNEARCAAGCLEHDRRRGHGRSGQRLSAHRARIAVLSRARDRVGRRGARAHVQGGLRPAVRDLLLERHDRLQRVERPREAAGVLVDAPAGPDPHRRPHQELVAGARQLQRGSAKQASVRPARSRARRSSRPLVRGAGAARSGPYSSRSSSCSPTSISPVPIGGSGGTMPRPTRISSELIVRDRGDGRHLAIGNRIAEAVRLDVGGGRLRESAAVHLNAEIVRADAKVAAAAVGGLE